MDKKNTTIGVLLLLAAFAVIYFAPRSAPPANKPAGDKAVANTPGAPAVSPAALPAPGKDAPPPQSAVNAAFAAVHTESAEAVVTTLHNDYIEARFTDSGGALREVALIKRNEKGRLIYPDKLGSNRPMAINSLNADPLLAFVDYPGLDRNARFQRVSQTDSKVVYRATLDNGLEVTRQYVLAPNAGPNTDPYQIRYETTFRNTAQQPVQPMRVSLSIGTAAPINASDPGIQLTTGFSTGSNREFIPRSKLESSGGFFGIGAHPAAPYLVSTGSLVWTAVKNQFFTSIVTGDQPAAELVSRRVKLLNTLPDADSSAYGITGAAKFDVPAIPAGGEAKLGGNVYVGPKEYRRLANTNVFKADQDKIMDFGFFKFFSQILLTLMTWIHGWTSNWGVAIILTTLTLKTIFIPFTLAASKSAKRMAKIQPELQAIREKYKDNPQKQQQATMELFKTRKINPVGGCFPILITIPFFMGFFTMLQSAAELRFSPFLWAPDLSSTDTVAVLFGLLPLNIMPLLMGATMVVQMHLTPSPSVDNMQMKMMKFMPYIFTLFCYSFSCALSLYSFVNGMFTIGQQLVINKMKEPEEKPVAKSGPGGKPLKNVTPVAHKKLKG
jgi:YidC/Oxa1 family membrane protein insertase